MACILPYIFKLCFVLVGYIYFKRFLEGSEQKISWPVDKQWTVLENTGLSSVSVFLEKWFYVSSYIILDLKCLSCYYVWCYCYMKVFIYIILKTSCHWNSLPFFWSLVHGACLFPNFICGDLYLQKLSSFWQVLGPKIILELSSKLHCYQVPQVLVSMCLISAHKGEAM